MPINLNLDPQAHIGTTRLSWTFKEFHPIKRSRTWWLTASGLSLIMLIYAVFSGNFLFALILLMGAILFVNETKRPPRSIDCRITSNGIAVGKKFWRWSELKDFWIAYRPPEITNLYIQPKNALDPRLTIPLADNNPIKVRESLKDYLTEDLSREDEPTSEALTRLLKLQ